MSEPDLWRPASAPAPHGHRWSRGDPRRHRAAVRRHPDVDDDRVRSAGRDRARAQRLVGASLGIGHGASDGDRHVLARRLCGLAHVVLGDGDTRAATALGEESAAMFRAAGADEGLLWALLVLGLARYAAGDLSGGDAWTWEALAVNQRVGNGLATAHASLQLCYGAAADLAAARGHLVRGVDALDTLGWPADEPDWLWAGALVAAGEGRTDLALRFVGAAEAQGRRRVSYLHRQARSALDRTGILVPVTSRRLAAEGARIPPGDLMVELAEPERHEPDPLSPRERELVELVAEGLSNAQIAEALYISKRTVESHVNHIKQKLACDTRAKVIAWALRRTLARM